MLFKQTIIGVLVIYILWSFYTFLFNPPNFLIPNPLEVWTIIISMPDQLLYHTKVTVIEFTIGLTLGIVLALALSFGTVLSQLLDNLLSPIAIVMQSIPKIALAPLFIVWFGYGIGPKIIITCIQ